MKYTIAATGNSVLNRKALNVKNQAYQDLIKMIRDADVAFANLEFSCPDEPWLPSTKADGIHMELYVGVETFVLDEMKGTGFNLFNNANNHAADYLFTGILDTKRKCEERGMVVAGSGVDLQAASAPAYLESNGKKISLIAATSTWIPGANAGLSRNGRPGRPGLNAVRIDSKHVLNEECYSLLEKLDELTGSKATRELMQSINLWKDDGTLRFAEGRFVKGEQNGLEESIYPEDADRLIASVREARKNSDIVILSFHHHQAATKDADPGMPPEYLQDLAHRAIDAGADIVIGHTHQIRPVEIYNGKPILYSPGNFYYTLGEINKYPADGYSQHGFDETATGETINDFWAALLGIPHEWSSTAMFLNYEDDKLESITVHPLDLQYQTEEQGIPKLADKEFGKNLLERMKELCAKVGTTLVITDAGEHMVGTIVLS